MIFAGDTLFTHPKYPPLVYENGEYDFYRYNVKYIPQNMLHCFKILGTIPLKQLAVFTNRTETEVVERGIYDRGYRIRKEFCLTSYSPFSQFFFERNIYAPYSMETYILLAFHQYLTQKEITWSKNKKLALDNLNDVNRSYKKRAKYYYKSYKLKREEDEKSSTDFNPEVTEFDWIYTW